MHGGEAGCPAGGLYGYAATPGYDCATGLGSVDVYNLVSALAEKTPTGTTLAASPTLTTEGAPVTLTATVAVAPSAPLTTNVMAGSVSFAFQTYLANGDPDLTWTLGTAAIAGGTTTSGTARLTTAIPSGAGDRRVAHG